MNSISSKNKQSLYENSFFIKHSTSEITLHALYPIYIFYEKWRSDRSAVFQDWPNVRVVSQFKYFGVTRIELPEYYSISNDLHDALLTKNNSQFWKIWKSRFGSERADNQMVDGLVDPVRISQLFADYFCGVCKPSSEEVNTRLREKFEYKFINHCGDKIALDEYFSVELISKLICDLKVGKSAGYDGIAAEHLLHCHPSCHVYITYLCNLMLLTGYVPSQFGIGLTFPIPKGKLGKKNLLSGRFQRNQC